MTQNTAINDRFPACLAVTLAYEGGLSLVRSDPGNWTGGRVGVGTLNGTNLGISAATHPDLDIRTLTVGDAAPIYRDDYWLPAACDALPAGLDLAHFDGCVNSGLSRAATWLAKAKGATTADRIRAYADARLSFLEALRSWATFKKGWSARVAGVEAKALAMAAASGLVPATTVAVAAKSQSRSASMAAVTAHTGSVIAGAAVMGATATPHPVAGGVLALAAALGTAASAFAHWRASARAAALNHTA